MQYQPLLCNILNWHITKHSRRKFMACNKLKTKYSKSQKEKFNKLYKMHLKERDVAIASAAAGDSHLEHSILDVWSIIMNKKQLSRQTCLQAFFPILRSKHFFFVVFQFANKTVNIIGNLMLPEKPSTRYGNCDTLLKLAKSLLPDAKMLLLKTIYAKTNYQDNIDLYNCGIHTMHHLETYYDDLQSWDHVFQKEKEALLRILRVKYAARILLDPDNLL
ncbi:hypothetical protein Cgig2_023122 [Carnegiea gigantea]|uniref:Ubiquitin-like protease family profile domain-containing protein n=1 Tax=Carnegiea gigantea TaxID=171969 RepID=A0A9Q1Q5G5_9CARY|nr:hypothetical protein Cgig2_023122 [Carnegiea gigantea]